MNCGLYCMQEYAKMYGIKLDVYYDKQYMSMLQMIEMLKSYGIYANGYYRKSVCKQAPYIIFLPNQKHFMLVKKIGYMVELCDQRISSVKIPYILFKFLYRGYYLKIEHICFRQDLKECV